MTTKRTETNEAASSHATMADKEFVMDLLRGLPDDVTIYDIVQRLEFVAAVRQGLTNLNDGRSVSIEQIERDLSSWSLTVGHKRKRHNKAHNKRKAGDSLKPPAP